MARRRIFYWLAFVLLASAAAYLITEVVFETDKSLPTIEEFVVRNDKVSAQVGDIEAIELVKRVSVHATVDSHPYRLYTFLVEGGRSKAEVVVHAEESGLDDGQERFLITKLVPY